MIQLCNTFLARSIALKKCYLLMNFEENSFYHFLNIRKNANFDGQALINVIFWKVSYPNIFFGKYVPLVVSKPYTKSQQLSLSKLASSNILINPSSSDHPIWRQTVEAFDRKMKNCQG